jgi:WD40 repeat protein
MHHSFHLLKTFNGWCFHAFTPNKKIAILQEDLSIPNNNYVAINLDNGEVLDNSEKVLIDIDFSKYIYKDDNNFTAIWDEENILSPNKKYLITGGTESPNGIESLLHGFKIWDLDNNDLPETKSFKSLEVSYKDVLVGKFSSDPQIFTYYALEHLDMVSIGLSNLNILNLTDYQSLLSVPSLNCVCTSDDMQLVAYQQDKRLHVFSIKDKKLYIEDKFHHAISVIAISKNKRTLLSGNSNKTIGVWDIDSGNPELIQTLEGHPFNISKLDFSLDDQIIISTSKEHHWRKTNSPSTTILYKCTNT